MKRFSKCILLSILLCVMICASFAQSADRSAQAFVGGVDPSFNGAVTDGDGFVNKIVIQPDGKTIIVGTFVRVNNIPRRNIARLNSDGTLDTTFNSGTGTDLVISAVALQSNGKIIIGGEFNFYNDQFVDKLARLNADGSLDNSFNAQDFSGSVSDIVVYADDRILVGGIFNSPANMIMRLSPNGVIDSTFTSPTEFTGGISTIALQSDNKILVGGDFPSLSGLVRQRIARLNANGSVDTTFDTALGFDASVRKIVVEANGKIVVTGGFLLYKDIGTSGLIRLNTDAAIDRVFLINFPTTVSGNGVFVQSDGKIVAGFFNSATVTSEVIRFNIDGTRDLSFTTGSTGTLPMRDIKAQTDGKLLMVGDFISYNNQSKFRVLRTDANGVIDTAFNPNTTTPAAINSIVRQNDGKIVIGGNFKIVNGVRRSAVARLNADGSLDSSFAPPFEIVESVKSLVVQPDGKVVIAGSFTTLTTPRYRLLARLNSDGSLDTSFVGNTATNTAARVNSISLQADGKIIFTGLYFRTLSPPAGFSFVRLNQDGTLDTTFTPLQPRLGSVNTALVQSDGKIVIGGFFSPGQGGNLPRTSLARFNANGALDETFTSGAVISETSIFQVTCLAQRPDGKLYVGGSFAQIDNNILYRNTARLETDGKFDSTYNTSDSTNRGVATVAVQSDGKVIWGGNFSSYNGITANRIVRTNPDASYDPTLNIGTGASGDVLAIATQPDGKVIAGGAFDAFDGIAKFSLVRLLGSGINSVRRPFFDYDGDGKADVSVFRPSNGAWYLNRSTLGFAATTFGLASDKIVPADFDGDGKTDVAVYRDGNWYRLNSSNNTFVAVSFGLASDIPVPQDFDGDGKADQAVYRGGVWYLNRSTLGFAAISFGIANDKPVAADYDGDGKTDVAVYRNGVWYYLRSSDNGFVAVSFGVASDIPVVADYDGDGRADQAVYRSGIWHLNQSTAGFTAISFGLSTDKPVPADFDGDGKTDVAVFRDGNWYILQSTNGFSAQLFGQTGDKPTPNAFIP